MKETSPCQGCPDRHRACHDHCEAYQEWQERYHAQQQHFKDNRYQICIPSSYARDKLGGFNLHYDMKGRKFKRGGMQ